MGINKRQPRSSNKPFHVTNSRQALKTPGKCIFLLQFKVRYLKRDSNDHSIRNHQSLSDKKLQRRIFNIEFNRLRNTLDFTQSKKLRLMSRKFCLLNNRAASLIRQQYHSNTGMQISIPAYKQRKFLLAEKKDFFIHLSLLGGFLGLVGYLVIVCHHVH